MHRRRLRVNWARIDNFGDQLTPIILRHYGFMVFWTRPNRAELIGVGSILGGNRPDKIRVPSGYQGAIFGTGMMFDVPGPDLRGARILAIRGPLSAKVCRLDPARCRFGDPGLLADELFPKLPIVNEGRDLVVPHRVDRTLAARHPGKVLVPLTGSPARVVQAYRGAGSVVTSSLHGLVLADALGISACWEPHPGVLGDGFKFRDYAASLGIETTPGLYRIAPRARVEELKDGLRQALREYRR